MKYSDSIESYDENKSDWLSRRPACEICDEPITEDDAIYYNDQWCCRNCERSFWDNIREDFLTEVPTYDS